ncbi:carboxypeptidase-like regulatory domain-containing protein [Gramella sp. AN32]|uniref:Carboxypeptidase-like regulatory domain-containing protein n=1 Tax=Christiangramia antarctica TaxID=2058158 RepID=A0ABW5X7R0_9FLAO|nr:carboxypeptidase-like regulatory domain-containing protein [Gramella sp. AN32]MCM4155884.1 hypothetical protein [Gramella sp. AN32]
MIFRRILVFFLLLQPFILFAQERQIITGEIIADSVSRQGIHVINLTSEKGTTSDKNGRFKIPVGLKDSLYFSSVQLENKNYVIHQKDLQPQLLRIVLLPKFNELEEINLDDIRLSGVLSKDIDKLPKFIYEKLGIPFPEQRRSSLELAVNSASADPISLLLNTLNGNIKEIKKALENSEKGKLAIEAFEMLSPSIFLNEYGIAEIDGLNFMYFCQKYPQFKEVVHKNNALILMEYLHTKIDGFKNWRGLD